MVMIVSLVTMAAVSALLMILRINVTVTREHIQVGMFKGRIVPMEEIESVSVEEFSAFRDFFGWGIKIGRKGFGYISAGTNKGLRFHLKNEKSFLISTKREFEFESAVKMALKMSKPQN
jgi:hypothetical protein